MEGHCGATVAGDPYNCSSGPLGAFLLPDWLYGMRNTTIDACLHACAGCERCNFVSVSLPYRDCSWYSSCHQLHRTPASFQTYRRRESVASTRVCPSPSGAHVVVASPSLGPVVEVDARVLWLTSIRMSNAFESVCTLLSGVLKTLRAPHTLWRPRWIHDDGTHDSGESFNARRTAPHVQQLATLLNGTWQNGSALEPTPFGGHAASSRRVPPSSSGSQARPLPLCYAVDPSGEAVAFSFHPIFEDALPSGVDRLAYEAVRALQRAAFSRWGVRPPSAAVSIELVADTTRATGAAAAAAATSAPSAVVMMRGHVESRTGRRMHAGRGILNEQALRSTLVGAGYGEVAMLVPEELTLASLMARLSRTSLLVTMHGAAMINQVFLPLDASACVLEIFPPGMAYPTGFQLASVARHLHLALWLDWWDIDARVCESDAAFRTSAFHQQWGWNRTTLAGHQHACAARPPASAFEVNLCTGIAKAFDFILPLGPLRVLLAAARAHHALPLSGRLSAIGIVRPARLTRPQSPQPAATAATAGAGGARSAPAPPCVRALVLTSPRWHVASPRSAVTSRPAAAATSETLRPAAKAVLRLLQSLGFCARAASANGAAGPAGANGPAGAVGAAGAAGAAGAVGAAGNAAGATGATGGGGAAAAAAAAGADGTHRLASPKLSSRLLREVDLLVSLELSDLPRSPSISLELSDHGDRERAALANATAMGTVPAGATALLPVLPRSATWLQIFPFVPSSATTDTADTATRLGCLASGGGRRGGKSGGEGGSGRSHLQCGGAYAAGAPLGRVHHRGPRLHAFCEPRADGLHVVSRHRLRTLLQLVKFQRLPAGTHDRASALFA